MDLDHLVMNEEKENSSDYEELVNYDIGSDEYVKRAGKLVFSKIMTSNEKSYFNVLKNRLQCR
jgi:hypothetical protein